MQRLNKYIKIIIDVAFQTFTNFFNRNAPLLAAGISFYALFSVAPLGIFAVTIAKIFFSDTQARDMILSTVTKYSGHDIAFVLQQAMQATEKSKGGVLATIVGAGVVIFGGHSIFVQLRRALNATIGEPEDEEEESTFKDTVTAVVSERAFSFLTMFILGILLVIFTILTLAIGIAINVIDEYTSIPSWLGIAPFIDFVVSFFSVTFIIASMYRVLLAGTFKWREVLPGSMLVAAVFFVLKILVGYYLTTASMESTYGTAGSVIALMVWVYFTSLLVLFGAELNQQITIYQDLNKSEDTDYPSLFKDDEEDDLQKNIVPEQPHDSLSL